MSYFVVEYLNDVDDLTLREQHWMDAFQSASKGMNLAPAAGSSLGCVRTEEQRKVISDITKEFWGKEENRKAQSDRKIKFHEDNPDFLLCMSETTRRQHKENPEHALAQSARVKILSNTPEAIEDFTNRMAKWRETTTQEERTARGMKAVVTKGPDVMRMSEKKGSLTRLLSGKSRDRKDSDKLGISWLVSKSQNGTPRLDARAMWLEPTTGLTKVKSFSVARYGLMPAYYLACCAREEVQSRLVEETTQLLHE
jgi:hypothetical protein